MRAFVCDFWLENREKTSEIGNEYSDMRRNKNSSTFLSSGKSLDRKGIEFLMNQKTLMKSSSQIIFLKKEMRLMSLVKVLMLKWTLKLEQFSQILEGA